MKTSFLLLAFFSSCYLSAQSTVWREIREKMKNEEKTINEDDPQDLIAESDSVSIVADSTLIAPEAWDTNVTGTDQLNSEEYIPVNSEEYIPTDDSVYMDRLSKLPTIIELPYNQTVRRCIELYAERRRSLVEYMLGVENFYFPMIEETLDKYGLPLELKYLVIVESAMNPSALSRAGASGLWQFMMATGRMYGLEVNNLVDERRDPIKSTDAACRHLRDLYDMYGDWNLAIAAYNCGAGNVNKAIRRSGGERDYWTIYPYLPAETRSYVPFFIAANYIMNYYADHQLYPAENSMPLSTDTVTVNRMVHFDQIADILQVDKDILRALNPQYKRDVIPGNFRPQILKLPSDQTYAYAEREDEIASYRADELFTNRLYVESPATSHRHERITHRVAKGETVITIANKYGVSILDVLRWNRLKSNKVPVGRRLVLHVNNRGYSSNGTRSKSVSRPSSFASTELKKTESSGRSNSSSVEAVRYKVRPGDSFYTIAQKYRGYTSTDLMKLNNRTKNSSLKVGQYIMVPKI